MPHRTILVVDDEPQARLSLSITLERIGVGTVVTADSAAAARREIASRRLSAVLLDLRLADGSGEELLDELSAFRPELPVIVVSGDERVVTAVRCMRAHAADYLVKPVSAPELEGALRRVLERSALEHENRQLARLGSSATLHRPEDFAGIVTVDAEVHRLMLYAEMIAAGDAAILITGEPGTGKHLLARSIHDSSQRSGPLVEIRLDDPERAAEALFGVDGAVERSANGTMVVSLACAVDDPVQLRLLRLLRDHEWCRPGTDRTTRCAARVVMTTDRDMAGWVRDGGLRQDLYYFLRAHHIQLPPLRERRGDLPVLVHHLIGVAARRRNQPIPPIPPAVLRSALANPWPGNIRELEQAVDLALDRMQGERLDPGLFGAVPVHHPPALILPEVLPTLDEVRDQVVAEALRRTKGDLVEASRMLGMSRWGLSKRIKTQSVRRQS